MIFMMVKKNKKIIAPNDILCNMCNHGNLPPSKTFCVLKSCDKSWPLFSGFVAVFLGCTSTGRMGLCFLWFYVQELPKVLPAVVLVLKCLRRQGNGLLSSDRLGEAGNRTCDPWFTRHRFIPYTTAASQLATVFREILDCSCMEQALNDTLWHFIFLSSTYCHREFLT